MASTLHITNGDLAAAAIAESGVSGAVVPWRDVLHEGPVPDRLDPDELRMVRARFLAGLGWGELDRILSMLTERDAALLDFQQHDEVTLWFEHDLYDQLQLIQVLDWFAGRELGDTLLSLVGPNEYLSLVDLARLRELHTERGDVTGEQLALAQRAWEAFRSPDPTAIWLVLRDDTSALPYLAAALGRHLEEFPSVTTGLSRSETQALEAIRDGAPTLADAFRAAHREREDPLFLGDATFAAYLERLSEGTEPLVLAADGRRIRPPRRGEEDEEFWAGRPVLTDTGHAVLEGRRDWLAVREPDRWLGGVHLESGKPVWRWDSSKQRLTLERGS